MAVYRKTPDNSTFFWLLWVWIPGADNIRGLAGRDTIYGGKGIFVVEEKTRGGETKE